MKVAYIARATLYTSPGGDTKQLDQTASHLRLLGAEVEIFLSDQHVPYENFDLLHFFNIIRPADILKHADASGKPFVVSTIFLDYGDFEKQRGGFRGLMNKVFSPDMIEYMKAVARFIKNGEKINSWKYLLMGHKRAVRYIAQKALMLLPNSENEYRRFVKRYKMDRPYRVVPNGVDSTVASKVSKLNPEYQDAVVCVARVEERKNQLRMILALNDSPYKVYIHGKPSPNNVAYYEACRKAASTNIHFSTWLTEEQLYEMYHSARVHVLASFFETTGLSTLEAAVMGCNIVITEKGDTRDYFGDDAWYCDPFDTASIRKAVDEAFHSPYRENLREKILDKYTWHRAAEVTLAAYETVLKKQ